MRFSNPAIKFLAIAGASALVLLAALVFGAEPLPLRDLFLSHTLAQRIVFEFRLPRAVICFGVGAALSLIGVVYQILFRNSLAEPYVLGTASVVTLGAAVGEVFFLNTLAPPLIGLLGGLVLVFLLIWISMRSTSPERVLLFGMGVNFVFSALLFLMLSLKQQSLGGGSLRWLFGQVAWPTLIESSQLMLAVTVAAILLLRFSPHLDALSFGDLVARSLGVNPLKTRITLLTLSSVLLAWLVSKMGTIGFVGLVVPNFVRLLFRPSGSRYLLIISFLVGGNFLVFADMVSRTLHPPLEFPIGIITTILGGPIFLYLLWQRQARG